MSRNGGKGREAARHWQPQPPPAPAPAPATTPQQSDFSLASQHVDCFAGEQQDDVVPGVVTGSGTAASDRESVGCVVIVLPFDRSVSVQDSDVDEPKKTQPRNRTAY
jgi:hypothetical protein